MLSQPETEKLVLMPLRNPATGKSSTRFWYAGSVDLVQGSRVIDWKSSSDPATFSSKKAIGFQPECYALALRRLGYEITEYEYRVIQTPSIKFCSKDEDAQAFEERCVEWLLGQDGTLMSIIGPVTEASLKQAEAWLWAVKERIQLSRRTGARLCNESACSSFGSLCPFVPLCTAAKAGDDVQYLIDSYFEKKGAAHAELDLPKHVKQENVITYSAAAKFSSCEMRHFWSYELALQKKGEETQTSLYIGSAMHKGLEHLSEGLEAALSHIDDWRRSNPVIGPDASHRQAQDVAKARAMVRAAHSRWYE